MEDLMVIKTTEEYNELLTRDKLVIVDIFAEWCGPCKNMMPVLNVLAEDSKETLDIVKMDVDNDGTGEILRTFNVRSIPTFAFIKDGKVQSVITGSKTRAELDSLIAEFS
jgi:thioredoxin 1